MHASHVAIGLSLLLACPSADRISKLADTYVEAIEKANKAHAQKPGEKTEAELSKRLPKKAIGALDKLLDTEESKGLAEALKSCADAALDLDRVEDFDRVRDRLAELSPEQAAELGVALSRERILLIGLNGLDTDYLEHFAEILEGVLEAYDEVFGFREFSKVPGKKLRVRLHLESEIKSPPHFAPQYPYHSEIDFPVIDAKRLNSPTEKGQFLFYGLCHELGHVIAMWGDRRNEEDHHAWAHYTGVVIVEHLANQRKKPKWLSHCRDVKWRSLEKEREQAEEAEASFDDRAGVLAFLIALHDLVGPEAIGSAINYLDEKNTRLRINHVRYYSFRELRKGLEATIKSKKKRKAIGKVFPD
jgi:hypothetical protein